MTLLRVERAQSDWQNRPHGRRNMQKNGNYHMAPSQSPAQLRGMFGENLRKLSRKYPSISELARQLGINRTQFNRYLSGESFPRPDVLARMCDFFGVDARVLLEPVDDLDTGSTDDLIANPYLRDFVGMAAQGVPEEAFPSGFYRFSRRSFLNADVFVVGLLQVRRDGKHTVLRGFETKDAMRLQGLPTDLQAREFRGLVMQQEKGITILAARRNAMTGSFNYLSRAASFQNNYWAGYVTRTVPESEGGMRVTRLAYEHLGHDRGAVLAAARSTGFRTESELEPFHRRLLRPEAEFS